jgi:penicillin-binding protein 1A
MPHRGDEKNPRPERKKRRTHSEAQEDVSVQPRKHRRVRSAVQALLLAAFWIVVALAGYIAFEASQLPSIAGLMDREKSHAVSIYDARGRLIARRGIDSGLPVILDELPDYVANAVIATEDRRFYNHFGVDLVGVFRALWVNFEAGKVKQGGSTITQQLAKNLFLTPERTMSRKVQEALLAIQLESAFSKNEIITLYLNRVYFGAGAYGVDAAARRYFNKPASRLSLKEAATLAGLLKAPSRYSPINDIELAYERASLVLKEMEEAGFIRAGDRRMAERTRPKVSLSSGVQGGQYFADWVMERLPGFAGRPNMDITVETTLNLEWQAHGEQALISALNADGEALNVSQGALIALGTDGAIRVMVGGRSYEDSEFNRATQARRQPGSAFKPFVFLTALEGGMSPSDKVLDAPFTKNGWTAKNFEKGPEREITLTQALAQSVNTSSVRLTNRFGASAVRRTAQRLGIASELQAVDSIGLGTEEVSLIELVNAYVPFATGGKGAIAYGIRRVIAADGTVLYARSGSGLGNVIEADKAGAMNLMLAEAMVSGTGKRARLAERPSAGKTGTTQDFRDAWFVGYTADLAAGVWIGNDRYEPMKKVTGGNFPTLIWKSFMTAAHAGLPAKPLPGLSGIAPLPEPEEDPSTFDRMLDGLFEDKQVRAKPALPAREAKADVTY